MKGLLLKELYQLKHSIKAQGFSLVLFVFLGLFMKSTVYVGMMVTVLITNMILLTIGYDEQCAWKRYALTMPLRRRDLITVKYLLLYILTIGSVVFTTLVGIPINILSDVSILESFLTAVGCAMFALLSTSCNLMLCTKYGVEKARLMTLVSYLIPFVAVWGIFSLIDKGIVDPTGISNAVWGLILTGVAVAILGLSVLFWQISCRIIEGQDL